MYQRLIPALVYIFTQLFQAKENINYQRNAFRINEFKELIKLKI